MSYVQQQIKLNSQNKPVQMALTAHRHCAFEIAACGSLIDDHKLQFDISQQ